MVLAVLEINSGELSRDDEIMKSGTALVIPVMLMKALILVSALAAAAEQPSMVPASEVTAQPEQTPVFRERDRLLAEATARAERLQTAYAANQFRVWQVLGGRPGLSDAKIVEYEDGKVTLLKQDGTTRTLPEARLGKIDRKYFDEWKKNTAPPSASSAKARPAAKSTTATKPTKPAKATSAPMPAMASNSPQ